MLTRPKQIAVSLLIIHRRGATDRTNIKQIAVNLLIIHSPRGA